MRKTWTCSGQDTPQTLMETFGGNASDCSVDVSERQSRSCTWTPKSMMPQSSFSRALLDNTHAHNTTLKSPLKHHIMPQQYALSFEEYFHKLVTMLLSDKYTH